MDPVNSSFFSELFIPVNIVAHFLGLCLGCMCIPVYISVCLCVCVCLTRLGRVLLCVNNMSRL